MQLNVSCRSQVRASSCDSNKSTNKVQQFHKSARPRPTTLQPPRSNGKTRGSYCSCTLLMMGGEMPETCWATHKRQVIKLWNCCILLVELFESYDDARTCEHQISKQLHLCIQNLVAIATSHLGSEDPWVNGWTKYKVRILKRIQIKYF